MSLWWPRRSFLSALFAALLALFIPGCQDGSPPDRLIAPQFHSGSDDGLTVLEGPLPLGVPQRATQLIGPEGGTIFVPGAGHWLDIPKGAVEVPTLFTITITLPLSADRVAPVEVDLTAAAGVFDIGALGFKKPVKLYLSYAWATNVEDPADLVIAYMPNGDHSLHVVLDTKVDEDQQVIVAELDHFSKYCAATN
ncbi:MAG: hypothetical protein HY561_12295 [Gemmatimonadetes bacterium]|nr:hypothetical protein [Gemmatimonadota bacterium]